jgi:excisionase family DNA binding protein
MSVSTLDRFRPKRRHEAAVYTVQEVAELLSLALGGTYVLLREGTIAAMRAGSRWLIPKKRFHVWLESLGKLDGDDDQGDEFEPEYGGAVPVTRGWR